MDLASLSLVGMMSILWQKGFNGLLCLVTTIIGVSSSTVTICPHAHEHSLIFFLSTTVLLSQKSGNSATTCMSHADLEGSEPDWGTSNARPWLKKHVMCCNLSSGF
jgi:hypothetical protein